MKALRRLWRLVATVIAIAGLGVAVLPGLDIRLDFSFFLPQNPRPEHLLIVDRLRDTAGGIVLIGISGDSAETIASASDSITEALVKSNRFTAIANGRSIPFDLSIAQPLVESRYLLTDTRTDTFAEHNLLTSLQQRMTSLASAHGWILRDLLLRDPTGAMEELIAQWQVKGPNIEHGVWMNDDATRAIMIGRTVASATDLDGQRDVADVINQVAAKWKDRGLIIEISGPGILALNSSQIIRVEMIVLSLVGTLMVTVILFSAFRDPTILVVVGLPLVMSVLIGAVVVQLLFGHVHGIALTFGATLAGVAIDYPLHLAVHRHEKESPAATAAHLAKPLMLSALTTIGGFLAIAMADLQGLAQLGTLTAVGMMAAYLLSRWVMPWLVPSGMGASSWRGRKAVTFVATHVRKSRFLLLGLLCICSVGALMKIESTWKNDIADLGVLPFEVRERDRILREEAGVPDARYIVIVRGQDEEQVLIRQEELRPALIAAQENGAIASFQMAADLLPSIATQRARQRLLPDSPELMARLMAPSAVLGIDIAVLVPFIEDVETQRHRDPLRARDLLPSPLAWRLEPFLRKERNQVTGLVLLGSPVDVGAMEALADSAGPEVFFLDLRLQVSRLLEDYRRSAIRWLVVGAVVGFAILFLGLRRFGATLRAAVPAGAAVVATLVFLVLCGIPLTLFHFLGLLLVGGIGVDYALFFSGHHLRYFQHGQNLQSIALCGASTITVFTTLAFSNTPVLHQIGLTVAFGIGCAMIATFAFYRPKIQVSP